VEDASILHVLDRGRGADLRGHGELHSFPVLALCDYGEFVLDFQAIVEAGSRTPSSG
jgi:hypothetical protein